MLRIAGDINLTDSHFNVGFGIGSKLQDGFDPFRKIERKDDDLWIGNFEGVASAVTNKSGWAAQQFRVEPESLSHLIHMDVYGFANNHAMEHGAEAYRQTMQTLERQGAKVFGTAGKHSTVIEHQGRTISLTAFSDRVDYQSSSPAYWYRPSFKEIEKEVEGLPSDAYKIVYVHWGNEYINYPSVEQQRFAHWLVDIGYDLIIGMHPHIMQGFEVYRGHHIFYSLGNFVFDMAWEPTKYGAVVDIDFTPPNRTNISMEYIRIGKDFTPEIVAEGEVPEHCQFAHLNTLIGKQENSEEYHQEVFCCYRLYRKANHRDIAVKMLRHPANALGLIKDFIRRRFI